MQALVALPQNNYSDSLNRLVQQDVVVPNNMERTGVASLLVLLMLSAPLTGCFADSENMPGEGDLEVGIASMDGGFFQNME